MQETSLSVRREDTRKVRAATTKLIMEDPLRTPILPPEPADQKDRGFNHPRTAELLCPAKYLDDLRQDPDKYDQHLTLISLIYP
jgi:hypothetical protein